MERRRRNPLRRGGRAAAACDDFRRSEQEPRRSEHITDVKKDTGQESPRNHHGEEVLVDRFKFWNAYVNGNLSPYFRVNYVLRGMVLPKGNNVLEFRFEPDCYYVGRKISYTSATIILFLFLGISFISIRKKIG